MRYAIVSDIHANLAAWQTVVADIADLKADKIICLGDVLGYGPAPVEVLESVYRVVHVTLLGNHDAAICGKLDAATFSPRAKATVLSHQEQLSESGMAWLKTLPLEFAFPGFRCTHGEFSEPNAFRYIVEPEDAMPSWKATREQLLFVGHSHLPAIYVIGASGTPHFVAPCDFELEEGKRYLINPGSVGYPRVGEYRSSYCVYDDITKSILFRQLHFDSEGYRKALRAAGLGDDVWLQERENLYNLPSLREGLSFAKPLPAEPHAHAAAEPVQISPPKPTRKKHLLLLIALAFFALLAAAVSTFRAGRAAQPVLAVEVPPFDLPSRNAYPLQPPDKNLLPVFPLSIDPDGRLQDWRYAFEDRTRQTFSTGLRDGAITLCIRNAGRFKAQLESPLINLAGTQLRALRLSGQTRKSDAFAGSVFYQLVTYSTQPDGSQLEVATYGFEVRDTKHKLTTPGAALSRKIQLTKPVTHVRFRVEADFDGTLELEQPTLTSPASDTLLAKKKR